ncbi:MAG: DUF1963 domain-containing protein [Aureispira sp.]|nr:DUF1963 domain-containing protein [Aureispira sp.]
MQLSRSFQPFEKKILDSKAPSIQIEATPTEHITISTSKFGGNPYLPKGEKLPQDQKAKNMLLLAQLNFGEIPDLEGYPAQGILQFFIGGKGYGCDFSNPTQQKNFCVRYYPSLADNYQTDFGDYTPSNDPMINPLAGGVYQLSFSVGEEYVPSSDVQFKKFMGDTVECFFENNFGETMYDTWDEYDQIIPRSKGHKMGGYADFTQDDPRRGGFEDYILLLQIDSTKGISWGDAGIGNFFIHPQDLANLDFSKVLYNWDCH